MIQEEIFGPVLSFETFATEDEAITRANATIFGLAAAIFTKMSTVRRGSPVPSRRAPSGPTLGDSQRRFRGGRL